jgi:glyoxylase-like metal-dependent hydrolase (beta-lactamase superfamily II)
MLKFISFGSGSSGNCYFLFFTEKDGLLIDTGVGIRTLKKYYKDNGLSISSIHNIIITHDHADHVKSVGSLSRDYGLSV